MARIKRFTCVIVAIAIAALAAQAHTGSRPPEPSPADVIADGSWTMVVLPDTQSYVDHSGLAPIFERMTQWIADNKDACNIELVLHVGDIVYQNGTPVAEWGTGDQTSIQQWENARRAMRRLDGVVPYIMAPGNHDYGYFDADNRFTQFNDYFKPTDNPLINPEQGGILAGMGLNAEGERTLENAYYDFTAPDGRRMLIFALEWGPRQAIVDWANEVAGREEYSGHTKVLLTHAYLYHDDTRYDWAAKGKSQSANPHAYAGTCVDTNDGEELWNELVKLHPRFELVLCGHVGGDMVGYLASENDFGEDVHQMLFNAQFLPFGGEGWLRILEFMPDGETVHVRTFSPLFALDGNATTPSWRTGTDDDFTFRISRVGVPDDSG